MIFLIYIIWSFRPSTERRSQRQLQRTQRRYCSIKYACPDFNRIHILEESCFRDLQCWQVSELVKGRVDTLLCLQLRGTDAVRREVLSAIILSITQVLKGPSLDQRSAFSGVDVTQGCPGLHRTRRKGLSRDATAQTAPKTHRTSFHNSRPTSSSSSL